MVSNTLQAKEWEFREITVASTYMHALTSIFNNLKSNTMFATTDLEKMSARFPLLL